MDPIEEEEADIVYVTETGEPLPPPKEEGEYWPDDDSSSDQGQYCPDDDSSSSEDGSTGYCPSDNSSSEDGSTSYCPHDSSSSEEEGEGYCPRDSSSCEKQTAWKGTVDSLAMLSDDSSADVYCPDDSSSMDEEDEEETAYYPTEQVSEEEPTPLETVRAPSEQPVRTRMTDHIGSIVTDLPPCPSDIPDNAPEQPQKADQRCIAVVEELERLAENVEIHDVVGNSMPQHSLRDLFIRVSESPTHAEAVRHFLIQAKRNGQGFPWIEPMPRSIEEDFMTPPDPDRPWETYCPRGIICQVFRRTTCLEQLNGTNGLAFSARSFVPCNVRALHMELEKMTLELRHLATLTPSTYETEHRVASLKAAIQTTMESLPQDRLTCTLCHLWDLNKYGIQKTGKKQQAIQWFHHLFEEDGEYSKKFMIKSNGDKSSLLNPVVEFNAAAYLLNTKSRRRLFPENGYLPGLVVSTTLCFRQGATIC